MRKQASSCLVRLCAIELGISPSGEDRLNKNRVQHGGSEQQHKDMAGLLSQFEELFKEPKGLPPTRSHDHVIPLEEAK